MRCSACHTAEMKTGPGHLFAELRNQTIRPYTDLLLHDMGDRPGRQAGGRPGQGQHVAYRAAVGHRLHRESDGQCCQRGYLHDGRARSLTEAVMWHGGESAASRQRFEKLTKTDRDALLTFLKSL
jgi:CxxC motif-containing protein (DUF1111 family)